MRSWGMRSLILLLSLLLSAPVPALAQSIPAPAPALAAAPLEDGPHVFWEGRQGRILRVRQGRVEETALAADGRLAVPGLPVLTLSPTPIQPEPAVFPMPARIAAVSDTHGNFSGLAGLLIQHGIMDASHRWTFGRDHLVVVGDTFDRGAGVTECLWLLRSLQAQAAKAGGRVHVLLGNHEAMVLAGDHRYVNPKYKALAGFPGLDLARLYGPASEEGRWVRSFNLMVRLGDVLFVHGGPSPALAKETGDLNALNAQVREALGQASRAAILGSAGPLWYRGLLPGANRTGDASEEEVTAILKAFHARILVVGHSTQPQVTAFHQGRVMGIDAGLQHAGQGELWLWDQGKAYRGLRDGSRVPLS